MIKFERTSVMNFENAMRVQRPERQIHLPAQ